MSPPSGTMLVRGLSPGPGQRLRKCGLRFGHLRPPGQLTAERVNKRIEIAGTVRPEQAEHVALGNLEVDSLDRLNSSRKALAQTVRLDRVHDQVLLSSFGPDPAVTSGPTDSSPL